MYYLSLFLFIAFNLCALEDSVVPLMNYFEDVEHLEKEKYAPLQLQEITKALKDKDKRVRILTFNLLFNIKDNKLDPIHRWPNRLMRVVETIKEMDPDVIGTQELYPVQIEDLLRELSPSYTFVEKECRHSEINGILFKKERFELINSKVWKNENSKELLRMVQLKDKKTEKVFAFFNTHLDYRSISLREEQTFFIAQEIQKQASQMPLFLTGDFNSFPNRPELALPYYDGNFINKILTSNALLNSCEQSLLGHLGPLSTFTNSEKDNAPFQGTGTPGVLLDRIYTSKEVTTLIHAINPVKIDGHFPSDHMPVLIDCLIH